MARAWYFFILTLAKLAFLALGGYRARGRERVPRRGPVLVCPNHCSHLDPPLVAVSMPRRLRFMAKEELFEVPGFGWLIRSLGAFPVRRGAGDAEAARLALEILKGGHALLLFPEGTRGDGRTLGPVNRGLAMLAKRSGAAILPALVVGTSRMLPKGAKRIRRGRTEVWFGEPFTYAEVASGRNEKENRELFVREWESRVLALAREAGLELRGAPSSPDPTPPGDPGPAF